MSESYHNAKVGGISDGSAEGERGASDYRIAQRQKHLFSGQPQQQVSAGKAGRELGEGLMTIIAGLFLHPVFSFVGFWLICTGLLLSMLGFMLHTTLGVDMDNPPVWYFILSLGIPVVLAVVFRKIVPTMMKWIFYIAIGGITLAFVGGIISGIIESSSSG